MSKTCVSNLIFTCTQFPTGKIALKNALWQIHLCQCFPDSAAASPQHQNSYVSPVPILKKSKRGSSTIHHLSSLAPLQMSHWINISFQVGKQNGKKELLPVCASSQITKLKPSSREKEQFDNKSTMTRPPAHLCQLSQSKDYSFSPDQSYSLSRDEQNLHPDPKCVAHVSMRKILEK